MWILLGIRAASVESLGGVQRDALKKWPGGPKIREIAAKYDNQYD